MAEVAYHPEAEAELQAAAARHLPRSERAAIGLAEEVDRTIELIQRFSEMQPLYDDWHRFAVLRRYP